jgi:ABC-type transporter Mla subunit MlaD
MYALRRTEPDLEGAATALRERETALRQIVRSSAASRPADLNARLRRVLERDQEASDQLRREMEAIRERMATTRQMVDSFGEAVAVAEDAP